MEREKYDDFGLIYPLGGRPRLLSDCLMVISMQNIMPLELLLSR